MVFNFAEISPTLLTLLESVGLRLGVPCYTDSLGLTLFCLR
jgi:hypothetical protein